VTTVRDSKAIEIRSASRPVSQHLAALASLGAAERDQDQTQERSCETSRDTLDWPPFDAILVRQIVIAMLFRFVVNVKFYFFMP
jgi:hypothetical protein